MAPIANLYAKYAYDSNRSSWPLPIVILVHGWGGDATSFDGDDTLARYASYGLFVCSVGMRGRNAADGSRDASGREIFDIYDAVTTIRSNFSDRVSMTAAAIVGYSGGGGNAFAAACKMPDMWTVVASFFGMSDYGRNNPDGWYYNGPVPYPAEIATSVGDIPAVVPDAYYARDATAAISNFTGGKLYMFHDQSDLTVPYVHSTRIKNTFDSASLNNYSYNISQAGDSVRWIHGYPAAQADLKTAEPILCADILTRSAWSVPASGTVTVIGYMQTKHFSIWLGSTSEFGGGLDEAVTLVYDIITGQYTVTPLTGAVDVFVQQGNLTANQAGIVGETTLIVS